MSRSNIQEMEGMFQPIPTVINLFSHLVGYNIGKLLLYKNYNK